MEKVKLGNVDCTIESTPIGNCLIEQPILALWVDEIKELEYTFHSGYDYNLEKDLYTTAKINELNGSKFLHVSTRELYRVVSIDSKNLSEKYGLKY